MSKRFQRESQTHEDIEHIVRCTPFYNFGEVLSGCSLITAQDAFTLLFVMWEELLSVSEVKTVDLRRWLISIGRIDVNVFIGCLKEADEIILRMIDGDNSFANYDTFKQYLRRSYSSAGMFLVPVRRLLMHYISTKDVATFKTIHQMLSFITRLTFEEFSNSLVADSIRHFEEIDDSLISPPDNKPAAFIDKYFDKYRWKISQDMFRHGNGAVADCKTSLCEKYRHMGRDVRTDYLDIQLDVHLPFERSSFMRQSKLQLVPKSATKLRSICMEPATLQWYQQGFFKSIDEYLQHHRYLRNRVTLHDQHYNADLAWEGSINGDFATIDLSDASDSVSWELVKQWFSRTELYNAILCSRSVSVLLPTGRVMPLKKVSGMGSALCFPIECIVFCSIVENSIKELGDQPESSRYRVYGDDIVIETKYASELMRQLRLYGFRPNLSKSFIAGSDYGYFRESCGGEYLNGVDVTPLRISRWFRGYREECEVSSWPASCVDMANASYMRYPFLRRFIVKKLLALPSRKGVLFNESGDGGLFSLLPDNHHLISRHSERYQSEWIYHGEYRCKPLGNSDDSVRLYEHLRRSLNRTTLTWPEDRVDVEDRAIARGAWVTVRSLKR